MWYIYWRAGEASLGYELDCPRNNRMVSYLKLVMNGEVILPAVLLAAITIKHHHQVVFPVPRI